MAMASKLSKLFAFRFPGSSSDDDIVSSSSTGYHPGTSGNSSSTTEEGGRKREGIGNNTGLSSSNVDAAMMVTNSNANGSGLGNERQRMRRSRTKFRPVLSTPLSEDLSGGRPAVRRSTSLPADVNGHTRHGKHAAEGLPNAQPQPADLGASLRVTDSEPSDPNNVPDPNDPHGSKVTLQTNDQGDGETTSKTNAPCSPKDSECSDRSSKESGDSSSPRRQVTGQSSSNSLSSEDSLKDDQRGVINPGSVAARSDELVKSSRGSGKEQSEDNIVTAGPVADKEEPVQADSNPQQNGDGDGGIRQAASNNSESANGHSTTARSTSPLIMNGGSERDRFPPDVSLSNSSFSSEDGHGRPAKHPRDMGYLYHASPSHQPFPYTHVHVHPPPPPPFFNNGGQGFYMGRPVRGDYPFQNHMFFPEFQPSVFPNHQLNRRRHDHNTYGGYVPNGRGYYPKPWTPRGYRGRQHGVISSPASRRGRGGLLIRGRGGYGSRGGGARFSPSRMTDHVPYYHPGYTRASRNRGGGNGGGGYVRRVYCEERTSRREERYREERVRSDVNGNCDRHHHLEAEEELTRGRTPYRTTLTRLASRHRSAPPTNHPLHLEEGDLIQRRRRRPRSLSILPHHLAHKSPQPRCQSRPAYDYSPRQFPDRYSQEEPRTPRGHYGPGVSPRSSRRPWMGSLLREFNGQSSGMRATTQQDFTHGNSHNNGVRSTTQQDFTYRNSHNGVRATTQQDFVHGNSHNNGVRAITQQDFAHRNSHNGVRATTQQDFVHGNSHNNGVRAITQQDFAHGNSHNNGVGAITQDAAAIANSQDTGLNEIPDNDPTISAENGKPDDTVYCQGGSNNDVPKPEPCQNGPAAYPNGSESNRNGPEPCQSGSARPQQSELSTVTEESELAKASSDNPDDDGGDNPCASAVHSGGPSTDSQRLNGAVENQHETLGTNQQRNNHQQYGQNHRNGPNSVQWRNFGPFSHKWSARPQWRDGPHIQKHFNPRRWATGPHQGNRAFVGAHQGRFEQERHGMNMTHWHPHHPCNSMWNDVSRNPAQNYAMGQQSMGVARSPPFPGTENLPADFLVKMMQLQMLHNQQHVDQMDPDHMLKAMMGMHLPPEATHTFNNLLMSQLVDNARGSDKPMTARSGAHQHSHRRFLHQSRSPGFEYNGDNQGIDLQMAAPNQGGNFANPNRPYTHWHQQSQQVFHTHVQSDFPKNRRQPNTNKPSRKPLKENRTQYVYFLDDQSKNTGKRPSQNVDNFRRGNCNHNVDQNVCDMNANVPRNLQAVRQHERSHRIQAFAHRSHEAPLHYHVEPVERLYPDTPNGNGLVYSAEAQPWSNRTEELNNNGPAEDGATGGDQLSTTAEPKEAQNGSHDLWPSNNGGESASQQAAAADPSNGNAGATNGQLPLVPHQQFAPMGMRNFVPSAPTPLQTPLLPFQFQPGQALSTPLLQALNTPLFHHPLHTPFLHPTLYPQQNIFQFPSPLPMGVPPTPNVFQFPDVTCQPPPPPTPMDKSYGFAGNQPLVYFPATQCVQPDQTPQPVDVNGNAV